MSGAGRAAATDVDGFVNLNKAVGMTSMDVLRRIKGITGQRHKVGHGGTMDPLAHGVLPICFGQATRLMDHVIAGPKGYRVEVHLGITTTTYDAEGEVVKTVPADNLEQVTRKMVEAALPPFIGTIQQTPPMYSAIKIQGQRLYKLARAGIEVERQARTVEIHDIQLREFLLPKLVLDVECGRGVYMRSLAHDLGEALGCGGYVTDLTRTHAGGFSLASAVTLEDLERANTTDPAGWQQYLHPVDWMLQGLKSISVGRAAEQCLRNGQSINLGRLAPEAAYLEQFRAYSAEGRFLALVQFERSNNTWQPMKVFHSRLPSPLAPVSTHP
ncbi:MAG: tRNA pseudouridine(55) synthase TruB [Dehalococcoidia bacterium]|nr:tRNA pseudouridine(55) synthase TruB [Dehalococcoidia bacterium]MSQ16809.1 tRNA pseudouridine(55) synthase TruB [Dehalococcoidia bacterium]